MHTRIDHRLERTGRLSRSVRDEAEERRPETARLEDRRFGDVGICRARNVCVKLTILWGG